MKRIIIPSILLILVIACNSQALNRDSWVLHHVNDKSEPFTLGEDTQKFYITDRLTYFTEGDDTLRFFFNESQIHFIGENYQLHPISNYMDSSIVHIDQRFWAVFPKTEESIDTIVCDSTLSDDPMGSYKIVSYPDQLKLLDIFLKDFFEHNHDRTLGGLRFGLFGTGDANVEISRRFPADAGLKELEELLSASKFRRDIDSILSRYDYRISDIGVDEAIFGLLPKDIFLKRNIIDNTQECPDSLIETCVSIRLENLHKPNVKNYMEEMPIKERILFQKEWIIEVAKYMYGLMSVSNKELGTFLLDEIVAQTNKAYDKQDAKALQCGFNDINEEAFDLDPANKRNLNKILMEKFGVDLEYFNKKTRAKIKSIIKRGKIKDIDEFYMVKEWIDRIADDEDNSSQVETLDKLLYDFETTYKPTDE